MRGKVAGREAIKNSIFTLVLLRETRSRRCVDRSAVTPENDASSHLQDTRVATACKKKMCRSKNIFCLADRTVILRVRPACKPLVASRFSPRPVYQLACGTLRRLFFCSQYRSRGHSE